MRVTGYIFLNLTLRMGYDDNWSDLKTSKVRKEGNTHWKSITGKRNVLMGM